MRLLTDTSEHTDLIFDRLLDILSDFRTDFLAGPDGEDYIIDYEQTDVFGDLSDVARLTLSPGGTTGGGEFFGDLVGVSIGLSDAITFTSDSRLCRYGTLADWVDGLLPTQAMIELFFRGDDQIILGSTRSNQSGSVGKGYAGDDRITAGRWEDSLSGGTGNDTLIGAERADTLLGETGRDQVQGGSGDDVLFGGPDGDFLSGGTGRDRLVGGLGKDVLSGGGADGVRDVFVFTTVTESAVGANVRDRIADFVRDSDVIDLSQIDARAGLDGNQTFAFAAQTATAHSVWFASTAGGIVLRADVTGDRQADFELELTSVFGLSAVDLVL